MFQICEPARRASRAIFHPVSSSICERLPFSGTWKYVPPLKFVATEPYFVVLDEWKYLLVRDRVGFPMIRNSSVLHELGDVLAEEGEGRVGDDDVRLFQKRDALGAAEITPPVDVAFRALCGLVALVGRASRRLCSPRRRRPRLFHMVELTASALGFWRLRSPRCIRGICCVPAMGEPS